MSETVKLQILSFPFIDFNKRFLVTNGAYNLNTMSTAARPNRSNTDGVYTIVLKKKREKKTGDPNTSYSPQSVLLINIRHCTLTQCSKTLHSQIDHSLPLSSYKAPWSRTQLHIQKLLLSDISDSLPRTLLRRPHSSPPQRQNKSDT